MEKEMVSTFMEITACESQAYAMQHLGSCRWNLEEAVNSYFNSGDDGGAAPSDVNVTKEDDDNFDDAGFSGGDDDVRAPIPAYVEALYEYDDAYYHGDRRGGAFDAPFGGEATYPAQVSAFSVQPTGWGGEAEPGYGGQAGVEDVDAAGDSHGGAAEKEGSSNDGGGRMVRNDEEDEDKDEGSNDDEDMSYDSSDEIDDYGFEMDEDDDDAYLASIVDDSAEEDQQQPPPRQHQQSSLADMYKLPLDLMCSEPFHYAKVRAASEDRFLLVNLQAPDFQSELYNRDLWSHEQVKDVVKECFVFLLAHKESTYPPDECSMVCTFYRLEHDQLPALLVLDPVTGMLLKKWSGPMTPDEFLKFVGAYTTSKPSTMSKPKFVFSALTGAATVVFEPEPAAPPEIPKPATEAPGEQQELDDKSAPATTTEAGSEAEEPVPVPEAKMAEEEEYDEEPMEGEKMYRFKIRFPDGTMVTKEFGCNRRVASLFKFCNSTVRGGGEAAAAEHKAFRIVRFAGGRFEALQGDGGATFEDLDLNCATVSVVFDT